MRPIVPAHGFSVLFLALRRIPLLMFLVLVPTTLEAQKSGTQTAGDVLHVLIPATAFAMAELRDDSEGRSQFLKSFLVNVGATSTLKFLVGRERPDGSDRRSFPSGHTSMAFQGASFIYFRYGGVPALAAFSGAVFTGYSRVFADKHYTSDVVAGAALGTLASFLLTDRFQSLHVTPVTGGGRYGFSARLAVGF